MIIKDVRTKLLRIPFMDPPRWSPEYRRPRELVVVEIETVSGIVGMGDLMPLNGGIATIDACLKELITQLAEQDASNVERVWQAL